jgi:putative transposon-encoded protein
MKRVKFEEKSELKLKNIKGFMKRKVVISGTSAKVTCPKEYLGSDAILIILENGTGKRGSPSKKREQKTKKRI